MGDEPPKRRHKPMWTKLRLAYYALAVISAGLSTAYWLLQLEHL